MSMPLRRVAYFNAAVWRRLIGFGVILVLALFPSLWSILIEFMLVSENATRSIYDYYKEVTFVGVAIAGATCADFIYFSGENIPARDIFNPFVIASSAMTGIAVVICIVLYMIGLMAEAQGVFLNGARVFFIAPTAAVVICALVAQLTIAYQIEVNRRREDAT